MKIFNTENLEIGSESKNLFKNSCIASVVIGLVTHAFAYFNATYFNDRTVQFLPILFNSARRAKWMAQFWDLITDFAYLPWLFGVLTIIFFSLSIYILADALEVKTKLNIWLLAGVCITNTSVINAHMYWPHEILVALPLALVSVWIWKREKIHIAVRIAIGALFVGLSLASYGAYTSVAPSVIIVVLLFSLIDGRDWWLIFKRGIEYIVTFISGMIFYYIVLRLFLYFQDIVLNEYASEDRLVSGFPKLPEIFGLMKRAWNSTIDSLGGELWINLMLIISVGLLIGQILRLGRKSLQPLNVFFIVVLLGVLPLSVGMIQILSFGIVHNLMKFTYVMPFIMMIVLLERERRTPYEKKVGKRAAAAMTITLTILMCVKLYYGILTANMAYMQLEKIDIASKSLVTRIVSRVEMCEGFEGNEILVIAGDVLQNDYVSAVDITGRNTWENLDENIMFKKYKNGFAWQGAFINLLCTDAGLTLDVIAYSPELYTSSEQNLINEMPDYPVDGSVKKVGDTIVIKLSDLPK